MTPFPLRRTPVQRLLVCVTVLSLVAGWLVARPELPAASAQGTPAFKTFDPPQVHPLALTPDGTRLLAVNSPNATLSVFQLTGGTPTLTAEIPVGLEPVSVAVRNDREAWVVNWLSDSVSVVDLASGNVTRTIDVGDEPTDVVFAGTGAQRAFVCVSGGASMTTFNSSINNLGPGQVKVFNPALPEAPPQVLSIFGKQPRALARDATGARVFVSVFESGNQTTIVPEPVVSANGGLPPPSVPMDASLPPAPKTSLIVKFNGTNWVDELNRSWNAHIPYRLADIDVAVIDANTASLAGNVRGVGTHNLNMVFDPTTNRLAVANLESTNAVRFEPVLKGRFQSSRVTFVNAQAGTTPSVGSTSDLNPHVNLNGPGSDAERAQSLAFPGDIVRLSDGSFVVAATSSGRLGVLDSSGSVQARVNVGAGPTGLALDEPRGRVYVLNRFDGTLSVVSTVARSELARVPLGNNPEPADVRAGRKLLNSADLSAHGTVSCASCHPGGHRDGIAWDLGNPQGQVDNLQGFMLHPMKGPMMTQSLRGNITADTPLHWRGDRAGLSSFNPAFVGLLGGTRELTPQEMSDFNAFIRSLSYPPNPNQTFGSFERSPVQSRIGFGFFNFDLLFAGNPDGSNRVNCSTCHLITDLKTGTDNLIIAKARLKGDQDFKTPQLRGIYQKMGMRHAPGEQLTGFGFAHDGSFDTLFNFMKAPQFDFRNAGNDATADSWRNDITTLLLTLDTGTAPVVGMMVTVNGDNAGSPAVTTRLNQLTSRAAAGDCDLVVRGLFGGSPRGFLRLPSGMFQPDSLAEAPMQLATLRAAAGPGAELTFIAVPPGRGRQMALDADGDNVLNDDEPRTSVSITGRVVNAAGAGVAGVAVTLSGSQTAVAQTDSTGRFVFGNVSTAGSHTVTPTGGAGSFAPASRTFASPTMNQDTLFLTPSSAPNAIDATQFFVRQQYRDFLNREADGPGLAFWSGQINNCNGNPACVDGQRNNVSGAFYLSIEFQETGFLVYRLTEASFDRMPAFADFFPDQRRLGAGVVVGQNDWEAQLARNKTAFFDAWAARPAFRAVFDPKTNEQFVDTLVANAGITPAQAGRDALVSGLNAGTRTRVAVLRDIVENAQFKTNEKNRAFVEMQYLGYLRRDFDPEGFTFWLGKLNDHGGDFHSAEMVRSFLVSGEYRGRFGP